MRACAAFIITILFTSAVRALPVAPTGSRPAAEASSDSAAAPVWQTDLTKAMNAARQTHKPVLVRAGAPWCGWCRKLDKEIEKPKVRKLLSGWTLVYLDIDKSPREARKLGVGGVPALRVLSGSGEVQASQDGYLPADELVTWLEQQKEQSAVESVEDLKGDEAPDSPAIAKVVALLNHRDVTARESAIRRLLPHPKIASGPVARTFAEGGLGVRLACLELLESWKAPIGGLDPWRPQTITEERLRVLKTWAGAGDRAISSQPASLSDSQLENARAELDKLASSDDSAEIRAVRERLARYGQALLPEVYARLKMAANDDVRVRLTALRYRLAASEERSAKWAAGLERLADPSAEIRHQTVEELAKTAKADDTPLLLELFSDPDPLVREISLRALQSAGGAGAGETLAKLLDDPEPNVRAAVLKQLAEKPSVKLVPRIADYVKREKDPDLMVHAIRVLRAAKGSEAIKCLMTLLENDVWQVRAEAVEALGECLIQGRSGTSSEMSADAYAALVRRLQDPDAFVVSRAVQMLSKSQLAVGLEALVESTEKHPELAADILKVMSENSNYRAKSEKHLRKLWGNADPKVRAAAIKGLASIAPDDVETELLAAIADSDSQVRVAAVEALISVLESGRQAERESSGRSTGATTHNVIVASESVGFWGSILGGRSSSKKSQPATQPVTTAESKPASQPESQAASAPAPADHVWLTNFRAGRGSPAWRKKAVEPLGRMLTGPPDERFVAGCALAILGAEVEVLPWLVQMSRDSAQRQIQLARVLPWLLWVNRRELFDQLVALKPQSGPLSAIAEAMAFWREARAAGPLWQLIQSPDASSRDAAVALNSLRQTYFGERYYDASTIETETRKRVAADSAAMVDAGSPMQRRIALVLLLSADGEKAAEAGKRIMDDPGNDAKLRLDAWQIRLLGLPEREARTAAVAALAGEDPPVRTLALRFLANGGADMGMLGERDIYLIYNNAKQHVTYASGSQPIVPEAPKGVSAESLRPLLKDSDGQTAAYAGYLLAVLGEPTGLKSLLSHWRAKAKEDEQWTRLVYRAIAVLDDQDQVPVLEEIYKRYPREDYRVREFYWTIRAMESEGAKALRSKIREDVGMDRLR